MDKNTDILNYFSHKIRKAINNLKKLELSNLNEINIINGQPIIVKINGQNHFLSYKGLCKDASDALIATKEEIDKSYELITQSSAYAYKRFITDGFLTVGNGHRVGIAGNYITENSNILNVNNINSLCFRVNSDVKTNIDLIFDEICCNNVIYNTIIISPPGCGKTTFLRNIARKISDQSNKRIIKCAIIDERFEIAACQNGIAQLDIGKTSVVISGLKKNVAIPMVVRSLAPDLIITDEVATLEDTDSIKYAKASGCNIIASTHGENEVNNELKLYNLSSIFDIIVVLNSDNGPGTVNKIIRREPISWF